MPSRSSPINCPAPSSRARSPAASGKRGEDGMRPNDQQTYLSRRRAGRLSATGLVLSVLGAGLSGLLVTDFFDLALARQLPLGTAARGSGAGKQLALGGERAFAA